MIMYEIILIPENATEKLWRKEKRISFCNNPLSFSFEQNISTERNNYKGEAAIKITGLEPLHTTDLFLYSMKTSENF